MTAQHVTIALAGSNLDVFQLEDGTRVGSLTSTAEAVGKTAQSISDFLNGKSPEALPYKGFLFQKVKSPRGNKPINAVPFDLMVAFWSYQAGRGNKDAQALLAAGILEMMERRVDGAMGVKKTEAVYEAQTAAKRQYLIDQALEATLAIETDRNNQKIYEEAKLARDAALAQMTLEEFNSYSETEYVRRLQRDLKAGRYIFVGSMPPKSHPAYQVYQQAIKQGLLVG